jgi:hypothetical protein
MLSEPLRRFVERPLQLRLLWQCLPDERGLRLGELPLRIRTELFAAKRDLLLRLCGLFVHHCDAVSDRRMQLRPEAAVLHVLGHGDLHRRPGALPALPNQLKRERRRMVSRRRRHLRWSR